MGGGCPCPAPAVGRGPLIACSTAQTTKGPRFSMATPNNLFIPEATLAAKMDLVPWNGVLLTDNVKIVPD